MKLFVYTGHRNINIKFSSSEGQYHNFNFSILYLVYYDIRCI